MFLSFIRLICLTKNRWRIYPQNQNYIVSIVLIADYMFYFAIDAYDELGLLIRSSVLLTSETAQHIQDAIKNGHPDIVTIRRLEVTERRAESLKDIATKKGFDCDEWPMAMFKEGWKGASVRYISPSDNRGAGAAIMHALKGKLKDTRVLFRIID